MPLLTISLFGEFRLYYQNTPITGITTPRHQSLLAYLILHGNKVHTRQQLAFHFWPDSTEKQARTNLRKAIYRFRHALPELEQFLLLDKQMVQWRPDGPFVLDVAEFETAITQAERAESNGEKRPFLEQAIRKYQVDLLPNLYDDWVLVERERLHQRFISALEQLIDLLEHERQYQPAIEFTQRLLRYDPLREASYRRLIRLQALAGNVAGALRTYHTCATTLQRELGVDPSPVTRRAHQRLLKLETPIAVTLPTRLPLVAREEEWADLQTAWQQVCAGQSTVVIISGEAGIGKTRLAEEMLDWAKRQGITTAATACYAAEGQLPYAPVADWLRSDSFCTVLPTLDEKWRLECARLLPELLTKQPDLLVPEPMTESWQRPHFFTALAHAILAASQPIILFIDDLQWCDSETLAWLHFLLRFDTSARILLLGTMRAEDMAADGLLTTWRQQLRRNGRLTEIVVGRLNAAATTALATYSTGRQLEPDLAVSLYQETEGHPLFIVEMARTHLQAPEAGLPDKVKAVIEMHLSQLSPLARELMGRAAVLGRSFTFDLLAAVSKGEGDGWLAALDELWQRGIVRELGTEAYDFSHGKIRQVAYDNLSVARCRLYHRQAAEALETLHASDLRVVSEQIAAHYEQTRSPEQAIPYYQQAIATSLAIYAHTNALAYLDRYLMLLEQVSVGLTDSAALAENSYRRGWGLIQRSQIFQLQKDTVAFNRDLQEMMRLLDTMDDPYLRAYVCYRQANAHIWEGQDEKAIKNAEEGVRLSQAASDRLLEAKCHRTLGLALRTQGNFSQASSAFERALQVYVEIGEVTGEVHVLGNLSTLYWHKGNYEQAIALARQALSRCDEADLSNRRRLPLGDMGAAAVALGEMALAQDCLLESLTIARQVRDRTQEIFCLGHLGLLHMQLNQPDEAIRHLEEALALAGRYGTQAEKWWLRKALENCTNKLLEKE